MKSLPTEILGSRYRIVRPLGGGGMKSVYLAEDLKLANRLCAVAAMIDNFANPSEQQAAIAAFQREADMLAALRNEHIPQVYDKFSEQQSHYLVMEFVEGDTLENRVKTEGGKLSEHEAIDIAIQILDTLEYLHGLKPQVIYRDMKPSNVMTTPDGKVKLIDFGIARFFQTSSMTTMGTPGYSPPEQYGGKVEERSDLYALAATLHEALTGRSPVPFDFPPLCKLRPGSNKQLSDLIEQALADKVEDRVPNAREFKQRLCAIKAELAAALQQSIQPAEQHNDRTGSMRRVTTQRDGQTWVFTDTTRMSGAIGRSSASLQRTGRQGLSRSFSPGASGGSSRGLTNNRTAVPRFGTLRGASGNIAPAEEQTAVLVPGSANDSLKAATSLEPSGHTWVFRGGSGQLPNGRRSGLKMLVGLASITAVAIAAVAGINQWNQIQREKALIAVHQAFEQQQQVALQEAERQRELLVQQEAQRERALRRQQQQQEAALERREWRIRQAQQAQQQASYPENEPAQAESAPGSDLGQVFAEGVVGAVGETVGQTIGQALVGGFSGSGRGRNR